jgi:DNA polymerase-1
VYNSPVQGAGGELLKRSMVRLRPYAVRHSWSLVNNVHDELMFEIPAGDAASAAACIKSEMEAAGGDLGLTVPIDADVGVGTARSAKA